VAASITGLIKESGLHAGDRLPTERALSERLGVSRTVVREAVKVLTAAGLVRARQGSGLYVANDPHPFATSLTMAWPVEPERILDLFEFRRTLEMRTAHLAAERITPREVHAVEEALAQHFRMARAGELEQFSHPSGITDQPNPDTLFHEGIASATHNDFFTRTVSTTHRLQTRAIALVLAHAPGSYLVAAEQHAAILDAIRRGDPEAAAAAMEAHIDTVRTAYLHEVRRLINHGVPRD
jgi:DNA-binding FadR family transcriptional regulator